MKNTKRKHLKLCLLLLFMVLGCFAITNVRTTTVQASSRTFKSNGRTYMEKHNDNTLNTEQVLPAHIRKTKMDLNLNEARWY